MGQCVVRAYWNLNQPKFGFIGCADCSSLDSQCQAESRGPRFTRMCGKLEIRKVKHGFHGFHSTHSWLLDTYNCWKSIDLEPKFQISIEFCNIDRLESNFWKFKGSIEPIKPMPRRPSKNCAVRIRVKRGSPVSNCKRAYEPVKVLNERWADTRTSGLMSLYYIQCLQVLLQQSPFYVLTNLFSMSLLE